MQRGIKPGFQLSSTALRKNAPDSVSFNYQLQIVGQNAFPIVLKYTLALSFLTNLYGNGV